MKYSVKYVGIFEGFIVKQDGAFNKRFLFSLLSPRYISWVMHIN